MRNSQYSTQALTRLSGEVFGHRYSQRKGHAQDHSGKSIPANKGQVGWVKINLEDLAMTGEAESLIDASYRHFALKRMYKALDQQITLQ